MDTKPKRIMPRTAPEERFWRYVDPTGFCWLWTGGKTKGYGSFYASPELGKVYAHRWAYEFLVGPIPDGMHLDHLCRILDCCNPDHVEPVQPLENFRRGHSPAAANVRKEFCKSGHEFTPENTYVRKDGTGRHCKACGNERNKKRYHARKQGD